jgi:hypothetical protein
LPPRPSPFPTSDRERSSSPSITTPTHSILRSSSVEARGHSALPARTATSSSAPPSGLRSPQGADKTKGLPHFVTLGDRQRKRKAARIPSPLAQTPQQPTPSHPQQASPATSLSSPLWIQTEPPHTLFPPGTTTITSDTTWARPGHAARPPGSARITAKEEEAKRKEKEEGTAKKESGGVETQPKHKDKEKSSGWRPRLFFSGSWLHGPSRHKVFASSKAVPPPQPSQPHLVQPQQQQPPTAVCIASFSLMLTRHDLIVHAVVCSACQQC